VASLLTTITSAGPGTDLIDSPIPRRFGSLRTSSPALPPVVPSRPEVAVQEPPPEPPRPFPLPERGLDRLRSHADDPRVRVGALLAVALVAGFVWYQLGAGDRSRPSVSAPAPASRVTTVAGASPTTATTGGGSLTVHVAGAVNRPGVVRIGSGARVVDAIDAAGGGQPDADLDRLNLAAKLVDGQRVAVARIGQPAPVEAGAAPGGPGTVGDPGAAGGAINVNTATQAQLEELPGIGPTLAAAIITERDRRGGFRDVAELQDVRGIGDARYADIKDLVSV
jgi:competence protein ComEA